MGILKILTNTSNTKARPFFSPYLSKRIEVHPYLWSEREISGPIGACVYDIVPYPVILSRALPPSLSIPHGGRAIFAICQQRREREGFVEGFVRLAFVFPPARILASFGVLAPPLRLYEPCKGRKKKKKAAKNG